MALELSSWLPKAEELSLGQRRRVDHDCGSGRTLLVTHKEAGYDAWCHRCSEGGFKPHPQPSLAERIAKLNAEKAADRAAQRASDPPTPSSHNPSDWPSAARVWLYKAGFSNEYIKDCGFYYSERLDRLVMPVIRDGRVAYWQARGFNPYKAKYINPPIEKPLAWYGNDGPTVLTEDILSAARCGEVARGCSILGTSLTDGAVSEILRQTDGAIFVWLDPDKAGRAGRGKAFSKLRLAGRCVKIIRTDQDPKYYSNDEIKEYIQSA